MISAKCDSNLSHYLKSMTQIGTSVVIRLDHGYTELSLSCNIASCRVKFHLD